MIKLTDRLRCARRVTAAVLERRDAMGKDPAATVLPNT